MHAYDEQDLPAIGVEETAHFSAPCSAARAGLRLRAGPRLRAGARASAMSPGNEAPCAIALSSRRLCAVPRKRVRSSSGWSRKAVGRENESEISIVRGLAVRQRAAAVDGRRLGGEHCRGSAVIAVAASGS